VSWPAIIESVNGRVLTGEAVDISSSGARLIVRGDLQVGSAVTLKVTLPQTAERLEVVARVTRRMADDVGVDFVGLPDSDARRLQTLLLASDGRRRAPRVRVDRPVIIEETFGATTPGRLEDLSQFGARVTSQRALKQGGLVSLLVEEMDAAGAMRLRAVVWDSQPTGTVLVFVNLAQAEFERLSAYVIRLLERVGG